MKHPILIGSALVLAASSTVFAAPAPVGLTLYAEQWNPAQTNGESLVTLESSPTLVSDTLNSAWSSFRGWYLSNIPSQLAGADYLHSVSPAVPSGITIYSRTGNSHKPPEMTLALQPELQLVPRGANAFTANFHIPGSTIGLCATTPSIAGKYADPCATFTVDMNLIVNVQISDAPGKMLQVTAATVNLANFQYGNENLPAEVAEIVTDIVKFFGGPDYQAMLVKTINSQHTSVQAMIQKPLDALDLRLQSYEQVALKNINQPLGSVGSFDRLVHLGVWARSSSASQMLTVLLAPPSGGLQLNPAGETAQFSGTLTFDSSFSPLPASCADFNHSPQITAQVQTGPRPVVALDPSNRPVYGNAPAQGLGVVFTGAALQGRSCAYTLGHLAFGLPNLVNFSNIQTKASGMPSTQKVTLIKPERWSNPVVLATNGTVVAVGGATGSGGGSALIAPIRGGGGTPQALNLIASIGVEVQQGEGLRPRQAQIGKLNPGDPVLDQQGRASNPAVAVANPASTTTSAPTTATPTWNQPAGAVGIPASNSAGTSSSSIRRSTTTGQQTGVQQAPMRTAPSSIGR